MADKPRLKIPITLKADYEKYLNPNRYWGLPFNFYILVGGRGIGKTTGFAMRCLQEWNKNGSQFVWVRRYKTEYSKIHELFDPIADGVTTNPIGKGGLEYKFNGERIGFGITLALQSTFKSGVDFSKVTNFFFDEAILMPGGKIQYMKGEADQLLELVSSVFRDRTNYRVFIFGNNLDIFNPYFAYFHVPSFKGSFADMERGLYCELIKDKEAFIEAQKKTPLAKLTKGTSYYDYHYLNEVLVPNDSVELGSKENNDRLLFRLVADQKTINIYQHGVHQFFAELRNKPIVDDISFTIIKDGKINYYFQRLLKTSAVGKVLSKKWFKGEIVCDSIDCKAVMATLMESLK